MRTFALIVVAALALAAAGGVRAATAVSERAVVQATTAAHDAARDLEAATLAFQAAWAAPGPGPISQAATAVSTRAAALITAMRQAVGARYMPPAIEAMGVVMKFVTAATDVNTFATGVHASEQMFATLLLMNARNLLTLLPATVPPSTTGGAAAAAASAALAPPRFLAVEEEEEDEAVDEDDAAAEQADDEEEVDADEAEAQDEAEALAFVAVGGAWSDVRDQAVAAQAAAATLAPMVTQRLAAVSAAATALVTKAATALQAAQTLSALWTAYTNSAAAKAAGVAASMGGVSAASAVLTAQQALSTAQQLAGAVSAATNGWPAVLPKCPLAVAAGDNAVKALAAIARSNP